MIRFDQPAQNYIKRCIPRPNAMRSDCGDTQLVIAVELTLFLKLTMPEMAT